MSYSPFTLNLWKHYQDCVIQPKQIVQLWTSSTTYPSNSRYGKFIFVARGQTAGGRVFLTRPPRPDHFHTYDISPSLWNCDHHLLVWSKNVHRQEAPSAPRSSSIPPLLLDAHRPDAASSPTTATYASKRRKLFSPHTNLLGNW